MTIETERLIMRPWEESDAEDLYRIASDPLVGPPADWQPHDSVQHSLGVIRTVLSSGETYALVLKETGRPIGCAGIIFPPHANVPLADGEAEIGYWLGSEYWGRGLTPEAVKALEIRAFAGLGLSALWCAYFDGNDRSRRVSEKCGFAYVRSLYGVPSNLGGTRTEHLARLTRAQWETLSPQ